MAVRARRAGVASTGAFGFLALVMTAAIVACSNLGETTGVNVGPNFPSKTLYATNTQPKRDQHLYERHEERRQARPIKIGGSKHDPQRAAVSRVRSRAESLGDELQPSTQARGVIEFEALATGNVVPLQLDAARGTAARHRVHAKAADAGTVELGKPDSAHHGDRRHRSRRRPIRDSILLFIAGATTPYQAIAGPRPGLKLPGGVAIDRSRAHLRHEHRRRNRSSSSCCRRRRRRPSRRRRLSRRRRPSRRRRRPDRRADPDARRRRRRP